MKASRFCRAERSDGAAHLVAWPRGEAAACKAVHTGSNPVATSLTEAGLSTLPEHAPGGRRAIGAAVARFPDTEEVAGSIPVPPTRKPLRNQGLFCFLADLSPVEVLEQDGK